MAQKLRIYFPLKRKLKVKDISAYVLRDKKMNCKMTNIFRTLLCALMLTSYASTKAQASVSSIMIDAESGEILSESNADELRYPASLTKLMTLYITFDALEKGIIKWEDKLPVSRKAANMSPSKIGVKRGEKIKVGDAVMALIVKSANDCAVVLAEGLGYSEENFAKTMTQVAHELGMEDTTFYNASGLPNKKQKTTARDMALLGAAIYHHFPQYYKLFATKKFTYQGRTIYTHNHLLKTFEGADGMKTGFTNAAGYNIVTSAERNGHRVIAVTMGHRILKQRDQKVASMMENGLQKLALNNHTDESIVVAEANTAHEGMVTNSLSAPDSNETSAWGIQVGAFSNYAKARNYALNIKNELIKKADDKTIDVEPYQTGSAVIYRSKIIGFDKKEAKSLCSRLQKSHKSCIVIAANKSELTLANRF